MEKAEQQLLWVALDEHVVLPPEIGARAAQAASALLLQIIGVEHQRARGAKESKEGEVDDPRS